MASPESSSRSRSWRPAGRRGSSSPGESRSSPGRTRLPCRSRSMSSRTRRLRPGSLPAGERRGAAAPGPRCDEAVRPEVRARADRLRAAARRVGGADRTERRRQVDFAGAARPRPRALGRGNRAPRGREHRLGAAAPGAVREADAAREPRALCAAPRGGSSGGGRRAPHRRIRASGRHRRRRSLGRQSSEAEPRDRAPRQARGSAPRRADRIAGPRAARPSLGPPGCAATGRRRTGLRHAAARGGRAPCRPCDRAPRRRRGICRAGCGIRGRRDARMTQVALLLRKDTLILRRSPLLLGLLIAYPLLIALLVGLVAGYANSKPRVALVDEDGLPRIVTVGGHEFDVDKTIKRVSKDVALVRLSAAAARREFRSGKVVAVLTVPEGFVSTLQGMVTSPKLEVQTARGIISSRVDEQVQALVFGLNRQLQTAYINTDLGYVRLILQGGKGSFIGREFTVLGLANAERLLSRQ